MRSAARLTHPRLRSGHVISRLKPFLQMDPVISKSAVFLRQGLGHMFVMEFMQVFVRSTFHRCVYYLASDPRWTLASMFILGGELFTAVAFMSRVIVDAKPCAAMYLAC